MRSLNFCNYCHDFILLNCTFEIALLKPLKQEKQRKHFRVIELGQKLRRSVQRSRNLLGAFSWWLTRGITRRILSAPYTSSLLGVPARAVMVGASALGPEGPIWCRHCVPLSGYYDDFLPLKGLKSQRRKVTECLSYAEVHLRQMAQFGVEWKKQAVPGSIGELVHHVANIKAGRPGCVTSTEFLHAHVNARQKLFINF